jgi:hypothetical protein
MIDFAHYAEKLPLSRILKGLVYSIFCEKYDLSCLSQTMLLSSYRTTAHTME